MLSTSGLWYFVESNNATILDNKISSSGGGEVTEVWEGGREGGGQKGYLATRLGCAARSKANDYCKESFLKHTLDDDL